MSATWRLVEEQLDRAQQAGRKVRFWLRDDDAVAVTPALDRLRDLCAEAGMPVLLAVIPAPAEDPLGPWVEANPSFTPCQHGYSHANHAAAGARACELGGERLHAIVLDELGRGRQRLEGLFGPRLADILVPPWNRIDPTLVPRLPALGFDALSTFGLAAPAQDGMRRLNCDLDIIDWRNGRVGRSFGDVCQRLAALVADGRDTGQPIGILTHHLVHDDRAWEALQTTLGPLAAHPAAVFVGAGALLRD